MACVRHGVVASNSRYLMLLGSSEYLILIFVTVMITVWLSIRRIRSGVQ